MLVSDLWIPFLKNEALHERCEKSPGGDKPSPRIQPWILLPSWISSRFLLRCQRPCCGHYMERLHRDNTKPTAHLALPIKFLRGVHRNALWCANVTMLDWIVRRLQYYDVGTSVILHHFCCIAQSIGALFKLKPPCQIERL